MFTRKQSIDIRTIYYNRGFSHQAFKTIEELAELSQVIAKTVPNYEFKRSEKTFAIITEMADVLIMIEQMKVAFQIEDEEVNDEIQFKINREIQRIEKEREEAKEYEELKQSESI